MAVARGAKCRPDESSVGASGYAITTSVVAAMSGVTCARVNGSPFACAAFTASKMRPAGPVSITANPPLNPDRSPGGTAA